MRTFCDVSSRILLVQIAMLLLRSLDIGCSIGRFPPAKFIESFSLYWLKKLNCCFCVSKTLASDFENGDETLEEAQEKKKIVAKWSQPHITIAERMEHLWSDEVYELNMRLLFELN